MERWSIYSWIALPTVTYGGYALRLLTQANAPRSFRLTSFAWAAPMPACSYRCIDIASVLHVHTFMARTSLSIAVRHTGCATHVVGVLAQSGGFFLHIVKGEPNGASVGTTVTTIVAVLLVCAIGVLVYGLFAVR